MKKFTNALANESSPYLLQHAHNPVNWYPWGTEALERAKAEDKPILVSIGYAACHWCHVMERESFENEETANLMNELFINIKIDREERPDLDHIYMDAVQAIAGNGGWPLNVFLTPDCKPFYGGTYFPPARAFNRASWAEVLQGVSNLFQEKREEVERQAEELTNHINQSSNFSSLISTTNADNDIFFHKKQLDEIFKNLMANADKEWGGFGKAPKFPQTFTIRFLLKYYFLTENKDALDQACLSLDKMIAGGIYDHLAGGFSRYSTDDEWLAPHFEKMLYDNALLISTLSDAYKLTKKELYQRTIRHTITFLEHEMYAANGGYYAALDADSEGVEGKFYVWDKKEIADILGADTDLFCEYYDVTENGNWEHKNILRTLVDLQTFASNKNLPADDLELLFEQGRQKLLHQREMRIRPALDDKIILGWNALMNTALSHAFAALGEENYRKKAIENFDFLWDAFKEKNSFAFYHTYKNGDAKYPAFLDDYAFLIEASINLQEITSNNLYLEKARSLTQFLLEHFYDAEANMFFYTNKSQQDVIVRKKEIYDGAIPSANAIMASNLRYLSVVFNDPEFTINTKKIKWSTISTNMLSGLTAVIQKYPGSFGNWAKNLSTITIGSVEVAIVGNDFNQMRDNLLVNYLPDIVLQAAANSIENYPLLANKPVGNETLIFICRNNSCKQPLSELQNSVKTLNTIFKFQ